MSDEPRRPDATEFQATLDRPPAEMVGARGVWRGTKQEFKDALDYGELRRTPFGLKPIVFLIIFGAVAGLDGTVFGIAAPEIIRDLELDLTPLFNALGLVGFAGIFFTLWLGFLADRHRRVTMMGVGVAVTGVFSLFTSRSNNLKGFGLAQTGAGLGGVAAGTPTASLIADWYPVNTWGKVIAMSRLFGTIFGLAGPLLIPFLIRKTSTSPDSPNWRFPFYITGPLLIIIGLGIIFLLKEPIRGYLERLYIGVPEEMARIPEEIPSFGEAWRAIWSIRTLRRLFMAGIVGDAAGRIVGIFVTLFLLERYGLQLEDRAKLNLITAIPLIPASILAGGFADTLIARRPHRVLVYSGMISIVGSLFLLIFAFEPPLWIVYAQSMIFFTAISLIRPAEGILLLSILPSHVRTMGTAVQALSGIPGLLVYFFVVNTVVSQVGIQGGLLAAVPLFMVSAFISISAAGFFEGDVRAARASAIAGEDWRKAKESGTGKMLVCRDVDVEYDGVQVLFGVDFDVEEGQTIALLGTNGAGKSTLLRAISGTQEASSGAIVFDGRDISHMPPHEVAARGVIHMPGGRGVFPGLTVADNLALGNWMSTEKDGGKARLQEVYELFPVLDERRNENANSLSGGEQQMVSLAQALLGKPKLLMIDELSLGLSPAMVQNLIEVVRKINAQGTAIIIVEQSVNVALTVAERAIFMEKGEVKFIGKTEELLRRPDILRAVYVKGTGALTDGAPAGAMRTERDLRQIELADARPILEVASISKNFGGIKALQDVSFELREGEALGIIGPNGAGKTTLFDIICGFQLADEGKIIFDGNDISQMRPDERARLRLVRRFQDARLFPALTVYENLLVALESKMEVRNMALTALQVPQVRQAERRVRLRADRLIDLLDLGGYRDKFVRELSTGLRRITDLACVLAAEPKVLMLDEPSTGIAQAESEGLAPLLRRVRFETGCSMLIIEHDMPLISAISDELLAMIEGKVLMRGQPSEVLNDERLVQAYLGTSEEAIRRSGALT